MSQLLKSECLNQDDSEDQDIMYETPRRAGTKWFVRLAVQNPILEESGKLSTTGGSEMEGGP